MATLLSNKSPNVWQQPVKLSRKHERTNSYLERDALPTLHCFVVERLLKKKKKLFIVKEHRESGIYSPYCC